MASITQLAKELNLSIGTVSRILNDEKAPYAAETRRRVRERAAELGYRPNAVARALAMKRTNTVGLWARHLQGAYSSWVVSALSSQVAARDFHLVIRLYDNGPSDRKDPGYADIVSDIVDGVITHGMPPDDWLARTRRTQRPLPLVVTGGIVSSVYDLVGLDFRPAAQAAVEHLLETGRRRVALMTPPNPNDRRYQAYQSVMEAAGLRPEIIEMREGTRAEIRTQFLNYVVEYRYPEAVFCHNDDTAIAVYRALCDLGLNVPEDVALVGCDGIEDTEFLPVPITTIVQPVDEMARLAWEFLKTRMREPDAPLQQTVLEACLEVRASTLR